MPPQSGILHKNQQKQARQSAEHGPENYLRCYEKYTNPTNGKDYRPSTFRVQTWVQSCHPRGKTEETDQSSTPPETSAWDQKPPEKKELQAQVEGPTKRKCWPSGGRSRKMWGTHNECLCIAEEPSRSQNWNSRPCSKGNTGFRTAESTHTGDDTESLSQEHLDPCLHRWLCRERCEEWRQWCLHPSPRWNHLLPLHPSWWPELQLQSRSTRPESCHRTPDWGRLQPAEYCLAVWLPVCSSVSDKWPHWLSHPVATQQPAYSIRQQQSSAPVGASTCWHCWKRDCRQTGKGSSKTPSTSLLHHIQRSQDPSETEAEISLEIKKQWIWPTERPD